MKKLSDPLGTGRETLRGYGPPDTPPCAAAGQILGQGVTTPRKRPTPEYVTYARQNIAHLNGLQLIHRMLSTKKIIHRAGDWKNFDVSI